MSGGRRLGPQEGGSACVTCERQVGLEQALAIWG